MLPNIWSERQLFAFSGLDGPTDWQSCFVASTVGDDRRFGLRFHSSSPCELWIDASALPVQETRNAAVVSDFITRKLVTKEGTVRVDIVAGDQHRVFGRITGPDPLIKCVTVSLTEEATAVELGIEDTEGQRSFTVAHSPSPAEPCRDFDALVERSRAYFDRCPKPDLPDGQAATFLKACSVLKVNVESAQGVIPCRWTTPDRIPHRKMWLWDSAFHAIGLRHLDVAVAQDALMAVFHKQKPDGFIPHMMSPIDDSDSSITQPPVLAWAAWKVFERSGDRTFLEAAFPHLTGYLEWDIANRRPTDKWLFAWEDGNESGMDNSPRFDSGEPFYAIDFSTFMAHECEHVALIGRELGRGGSSTLWTDRQKIIADAINAELWDDELGFYLDRYLDGTSTGVKSESGFLPLLAGICGETQCQKLTEHLRSEDEFWRPFPVSSVSADSPAYGDDMWRGPVWINYNWMIIRGLERTAKGLSSVDCPRSTYAQQGEPSMKDSPRALADELKEKTLSEISRWYHTEGCIFEFYDAEGRVSPLKLDRKGYKQAPRRMACIADYNWSAAAFVDLAMVPTEETL